MAKCQKALQNARVKQRTPGRHIKQSNTLSLPHHGANLALNSDVDQDTFGTVEKHNKHDSQEVSPFPAGDHKATRNRHDRTTHQHEA